MSFYKIAKYENISRSRVRQNISELFYFHSRRKFFSQNDYLSVEEISMRQKLPASGSAARNPTVIGRFGCRCTGEFPPWLLYPRPVPHGLRHSSRSDLSLPAIWRS